MKLKDVIEASQLLNLLVCLWQLPQIVVGLLALVYYRPRHILVAEKSVRVCYADRATSVVSFGFWVIVPLSMYRGDRRDALRLKPVQKAWLGHGLQSRWLGFFYLFVVTIPTAIHEAIAKSSGRDAADWWAYRWADKIVAKHV